MMIWYHGMVLWYNDMMIRPNDDNNGCWLGSTRQKHNWVFFTQPLSPNETRELALHHIKLLKEVLH